MCPAGVEVGDGDLVAFGGKRLGRRPADPGRPADHDGAPLVPVAHPVGPSTVKIRTRSNLVLGQTHDVTDLKMFDSISVAATPDEAREMLRLKGGNKVNF